MCMAVYIAADAPLAFISWDERLPAFHTTELNDEDEGVRGQFSKSHIIYAGSYEGCGCGFFKLEHAEYEEPGDLAACRESLSSLGDYLAGALRQHGSVELFTCWAGDQAQPPQSRGILTPADVTAGVLKWDARQFFTVQNAA
jgi:hypothetical protein